MGRGNGFGRLIGMVVPVLGVLLMCCGILAGPVPAAEYYVDSGAADDSGDGSLSLPWKTLHHALGNLLDGDTLNVQPGTYNVAGNGEPDLPLVVARNHVRIVGLGEPGSVVVDGAGATTAGWNSGILIAGYVNADAPVSGVVIEGLDIQGFSQSGIHINGADFTAVEGCRLHNNGADGIKVENGTGNIINSSQLYANPNGVWLTNSTQTLVQNGCQIFQNSVYGIHINYNSSGNQVGFSSIYDNGYTAAPGTGIYIEGSNNKIVNSGIYWSKDTAYPQGSGIFSDGGEFNFIHANEIAGHSVVGIQASYAYDAINIEANKLYDNLLGIGIKDSSVEIHRNFIKGSPNGIKVDAYGSTDWKIVNNLILGATENGIRVYGESSYNDMSMAIHHNTIDGAGSGIYFAFDSYGTSTPEISYNILSNAYICIDVNNIYGAPPNIDYNLFSLSEIDLSDPSGRASATNSIYSDPLFIDPGTDDYRLQPGSPAIDAVPAAAIAPDGFRTYEDFHRVSRPQGSGETVGYDVGCLEAIVFFDPTVTWTGSAGDGIWSTPGNWDTGSVPGATDRVHIPYGAMVGVNQNAAVLSIENRGTMTIASGVTFTVAGGIDSYAFAVNAPGGVVEGTGILDVVNADSAVNYGAFSPGGDFVVGTLTVMGNVRQDAAGGMEIDIQGSAAGAYDQLIVSGVLEPGGEIDIHFSGQTPYDPAVGDRFEILIYGSNPGGMTRLFFPDLPLDRLWRQVYGTDRFAVEVLASTEGGAGTAADPYRIALPEQLDFVRKRPSAHYLQIAEIDLGGFPFNVGPGWKPIGQSEENAGSSAGFVGTYDGNGFVIRNLFIDQPQEANLGLFGNLAWEAALRNIQLENASVTGAYVVGALVGESYGTISNCSAAGTVTGRASGSESIGGLIGSNYGPVEKSSSAATVSGSSNVGGLTGRNSGSIDMCFATGNVTGESFIGGLVGENMSGQIGNSYAVADVSATGDTVGGLVGSNGGNITSCYAAGSVSGGMEAYSIGGLVGEHYAYEGGSAVIAYSYYDKTVSGQTDTGRGEPRTTVQMQQGYENSTIDDGDPSTVDDSVYTNWSSLIWQFAPETEYPVHANTTPVVSVALSGSGSGRVISTPAGVDCGTVCSAAFAAGEPIALTAVADAGSVFAGWSGGTGAIACSGTADCSFSLDQNSSVTAVFVAFAGGSGTSEADPYLIETAEQLDSVRHVPGSFFRLNADIDLGGYATGEGWAPIGTSAAPFTGAFDGNGHTVRNLFIHRTGYNVGLFGIVEGAVIQNVRLENADVAGEINVGGLVAINDAAGIIANCRISGFVTGSAYVGGLVGSNAAYGSIENCASAAAVEGVNVVGGLLGVNSNGIVSGSYATGNVTGTGTGSSIGGLVGAVYGNGADGFVTDSFATGAVTGYQQTGGLAGSNSGTILRCYAVGRVSGELDAGGLVGATGTGGEVLQSYYDSVTTGRNDDAGKGVPRTTAEMLQRETFEVNGAAPEWDFTTVWNIEPGVSYPWLLWQTALISTGSAVESGALDPTVTVTLTGDIFATDTAVQSPANWSIDTGNTGFNLAGITRDSDTQATVRFTGTAAAGTIGIQAGEGAIAGRDETNRIAIIVSDPIVHTITAGAGANGTINPVGTVSVAGGGSQTFTITPDAGYKISDVLVDGVSVGPVGSYSFEYVTGDHSISAAFSLDGVTVNFAAANGGSLSGETTQVVSIGGQTAQVTAVPDEFWAFTGWSGDYTGSENPLVITYVSVNMQITANFNKLPESPELMSPADNTRVELPTGAETGLVDLVAGGYLDAENDAHAETFWRYWEYNNPSAEPVSSGTDLNLLQISVRPGIRYEWQAGFRDAGSNQIRWSEPATFLVGTPVVDTDVPPVAAGDSMANYRMISFVQWPNDPSAAAVFASLMSETYDRNFRIGSYDPMLNGAGGYREYPDFAVEPGRSYWFLARNGMSFEIEGVPVSTQASIYVRLAYNDATGNGWNQIGCPNRADYLWGDVQVIEYSAEGGILNGPFMVRNLPAENPYIEKTIWQWAEGVYTSSTSDAFLLEPYQGYWIRAKAPNICLIFEPSIQMVWTNPKAMVAGYYEMGRQWLAERVKPATAFADAEASPPMPMGGLDGKIDAGGGASCFVNTTIYGQAIKPFLTPMILMGLACGILALIMSYLMVQRSRQNDE